MFQQVLVPYNNSLKQNNVYLQEKVKSLEFDNRAIGVMKKKIKKLRVKRNKKIGNLLKGMETLREKNDMRMQTLQEKNDMRMEKLERMIQTLQEEKSDLQRKNAMVRSQCDLFLRKSLGQSMKIDTIQNYLLKQMDDLLNHPGEALYCSITQGVPQESMALCTCSVPHAFKHSALKRWLEHNESCPYSKEILRSRNVTVLPKAFCDKVNEVQKRLVKLQQLEEKQRIQNGKQKEAANALVTLSVMP